MSHDLRRQRLHGTESANATEDDGEAPVRLSHGALSAICNNGSEENSSGTERSEDSEEANERIMEARQLEEEYLRNKAAMEQRHRNIQKLKLERRGFFFGAIAEGCSILCRARNQDKRHRSSILESSGGEYNMFSYIFHLSPSNIMFFCVLTGVSKCERFG